jgi:metal-responsive CopG/Arc/MetJ family transcriptional regulator
MTKKSTTQTPVAIVSLSIDRDLLNRLDDQAEFEDRTRSKMITRMIEFYLERKQYEALDTNVPKVW